MSKWQVLLVKEIKHLFRDTKTIVQTVILPTFITPALLGAIFWYVGSIANEETKKTYDISAYSTIESNLITQLADSDRLNILSEESIDDDAGIPNVFHYVNLGIVYKFGKK